MKFEPLPWPGAPAVGSMRRPRHIALLGNLPPRRCGLATYTHDSYLALTSHPAAPQVDLYIMDDGQVEGYGPEVTMLVPDHDISAYQRAADAIDASGADMLWIQHEYGIFGGDSGSHLLALVNRVKVPVAITLHTILEQPGDSQRQVLSALLDRAETVVVMAEKGRDILARVYGIDPNRISVIAHGIPDRQQSDPVTVRARLGLAERPTILTFGLLAPDKGIADMIEAMPAIRASCADVHYVVLGATHPHLKRHEGEAYRESLIARVGELGLKNAVTFVDRFVELDELTDWLAAADVYVTPYRNAAQITSGTLSYAVGMGKAVVSTPYVHASEILADGRGCLVDFRSPNALAGVISGLLTDGAMRNAIGDRAYRHGRTMIWPRNADAVLTAMARGLRRNTPRSEVPGVPVLRSEPIERMTDDVGMFQHSILGIPDRRHGYCIDDNARGLLLMSIADDLPLDLRTRLATTYASFVQHGWNEDCGHYRNFMGYDRTWLESVGSEDSNGRTLWALGVAASGAPTAALRRWALGWYDRTVDALGPLESPRARAFAMLGAAQIAAVRPGDVRALNTLREGGEMLMSLVASHSRPDWSWFEIMLAYDNTRLPEALIRAGQILGDSRFIETGLDTLDWIDAKTTGHDGQFQPVGTTDFGAAFTDPSPFDQQPVEAWAMIDACAIAFKATADPRWIARATAAHDWFLGANTLSLSLIDPETGECGDGITPFETNANNGAESVIAWQAAHRAYRGLLESNDGVEDSVEPIAEAA